MAVKIIPSSKAVVLEAGGKKSKQLVSLENSPNSQVTITSVTMLPGAVSEVHTHSVSEQIWVVQAGTAELLLAGEVCHTISSGDVVITPPGTQHGIRNSGKEIFSYLSITAPPEDMRKYY
ncbi:Cupin domain protein [compost metagenome]